MCTFRRGGAITPLAPLFAGPYKVVARQAKFFKLEIGVGLEMVSEFTTDICHVLGVQPVHSERARPTAAL